MEDKIEYIKKFNLVKKKKIYTYISKYLVKYIKRERINACDIC